MTPAKIRELRERLIFELGVAYGQLARASEMEELAQVQPGDARIKLREEAEALQKKIKETFDLLQR